MTEQLHELFFLMALALLFTHELDAVRCREWRIFPLTYLAFAGGGGAKPHPVLKDLATKIRTAKRMMRDFAAARAWRERGGELEVKDLAAQLMRLIEGK